MPIVDRVKVDFVRPLLDLEPSAPFLVATPRNVRVDERVRTTPRFRTTASSSRMGTSILEMHVMLAPMAPLQQPCVLWHNPFAMNLRKLASSPQIQRRSRLANDRNTCIQC